MEGIKQIYRERAGKENGIVKALISEVGEAFEDHDEKKLTEICDFLEELDFDNSQNIRKNFKNGAEIGDLKREEELYFKLGSRFIQFKGAVRRDK